MAGIKSFILNKPASFFDDAIERADERTLSYGEIVSTNVRNTGSFKYDPLGSGLKSTQQLPVDWSQFKNHTFFDSAQAKVNVAFDKIINGYPFDGTKKEIEAFLDSLTGFEKYILDQFPKNKGYLFFDGSAYISVNDVAGADYPTLSKNDTGNNILDPGTNSSFTYEMQLFTYDDEYHNSQVVCQKLSGSANAGISLILTSSEASQSSRLIFAVTSGSTCLTASADMPKGKFNHVVATLDRSQPLHSAKLFINQVLAEQSSNIATIGAIDFKVSPLTIASGSSVILSSGTLTPTQPLSGAIDDFRVFHSIRPINQQKLFAEKSVYPDNSLRLYYKFNEPSGTLGASEASSLNSIVLDSSGNSLHSSITSYDSVLRNTSSINVPLTYEKLELSPVLFPAYGAVVELNTDLLVTASNYDNENPNLITRLIPRHYFIDGSVQEGLEDVDGTIIDSYGGSSAPGSGELGTSQLLTSFLFIYAKFFDELKMVVDSFSNILYVDYETTDFVPDQFLNFVASYYGFNIPNIFPQATVEQYIDAENITDIETSKLALQKVQNELLRRVLSDIQHVISSKGTKHSIKALIRSLGIDPDNSLRIKEFGGPHRRGLDSVYEKKSYIAGMLNMSSSQCLITSSYLSGSRLEVGYPQPHGTMVLNNQFLPHGMSSERTDGLFTSGSWTYEALYRYPKNLNLSSVTQSLARLQTTGSAITTPQTVVNLMAMSSSVPDLKLFVKAGINSEDSTSDNFLMLHLSGANIFDGSSWNISFGRERNDEINSSVSSSYFLRAAKQNDGKIQELYTTASYFQDSLGSAPVSVFQNISASYNSKGLFFAIGQQSLLEGTSAASYRFLNNTTYVANSEARAINFDGKVGNIRFWSKGIKIPEWKSHVVSKESLGVTQPLKNFNFEKTISGSFERLRLDVDMLQETTRSNAEGRIRLADFAQGGMTVSGKNFELSKQVIDKEQAVTTFISPYFDEMVLTDRVRIRSLKDTKNLADFQYAEVAPVYSIVKSEEVVDDPRFSIDFSLVDALNRDIVKMFSTLESLDNILGDPTLVYASEYKDLEQLRDTYFNRLTEKIKLNDFFTVFKWFDTLLNAFLKELMPEKTKFLGANFVMEPHMLERSRIRYFFCDQYLDENNKLIAPNIQNISGEGSGGGGIE